MLPAIGEPRVVEMSSEDRSLSLWQCPPPPAGIDISLIKLRKCCGTP